jgi:hypothetical protein
MPYEYLLFHIGASGSQGQGDVPSAHEKSEIMVR